MYTQCPSCKTMFRISEQQLTAAKGKVRCGKCNHVYNAQGTLMDTLPGQAVATPAVAKPEPVGPEISEATPEASIEESNIPDIPSPTDEPQQESLISPPQGVTEDDWQMVDLGNAGEAGKLTDSADEEDGGLFDDANGLAENHTDAELSAEDIPSITPPEGVDEEDWQMVNLGSDSDFSQQQQDNEEDDWLFDDDNGLPENETDDVPENGVDIVLRDEDAAIPEPFPEQYSAQNQESAADEIEETDQDDEEDSDFMRHMSDYVDDDTADELISDESAAGILDELNQQLSLAIENPEVEDEQQKQGIKLPTGDDWLDELEIPLTPTSVNSSIDEKEKQELNDAILQNIEISSDSDPAPTPSIEAKAEEAPDNFFNAKQSIVLEAASEPGNEHSIGQHDIPLRIRDSVGIEQEQPRSIFRWLTIFGSILILLIALFAQAIMFRSFDLANLYPDLQPILLKVCQQLPCRDSRQQDIHQIRLMSRNISQHPKTKSALLIKAAIINRANFAQRYPKIQITLSDVTGSTVAQRIFHPEEYLGSLYHPFLEMKPNKPVHIALEVIDPGSAAINFEFKFL